MKQNKRAFTLIELLVVVLIIGILAAVALPQYQFSVDKSRIAPYLTKVTDIKKTEHLYFLTNGKYTSNFYNLDLDFTKSCSYMNGNNELAACPNNISITLFESSKRIVLDYCSDSKCRYSYPTNTLIRATFSMETAELVSCKTYNDTTREEKLCKWLSLK